MELLFTLQWTFAFVLQQRLLLYARTWCWITSESTRKPSVLFLLCRKFDSGRIVCSEGVFYVRRRKGKSAAEENPEGLGTLRFVSFILIHEGLFTPAIKAENTYQSPTENTSEDKSSV